MVKIRLTRVGTRKQPKYRIVVTDESEKRNGRFIEIVGHYNPMQEPAEILLKKDRFDYWVSVGAQPTKVVEEIARKVTPK